MRGAARIGRKSFKIPKGNAGSESFNPFEALGLVGDLPVAPRLEPINDEWSWSIGAEPADPRDCARYPASPYCGELPLSATPIGYETEIKTNGCETCLYIYPVIAFLKMTPQVICHRDPNCGDKSPPPPNLDQLAGMTPKIYDENPQPGPYKSEECAFREGIINRWHNRWNRGTTANVKAYITGEAREDVYKKEIKIEKGDMSRSEGWTTPIPGDNIAPECQSFFGGDIFSDNNRPPYVFPVAADSYFRQYLAVIVRRQLTAQDPIFEYSEIFSYRGWEVSRCCGMGSPPPPPPILPPPPPPPENERGNRGGNRGKRGGKRGNEPPRRDKNMCCNDCTEAKDNTARLLKEIKEIKKTLGTGKLAKAVDAAVGIGDESVTALLNLLARRLGTDSYPIEVPESLLSGTSEGKIFKAQSNAEFLFWLTKQIDALVGEFPIDIKIEDIDPLKEGNQTKIIKLPNVAEAIAELYGLTMKSSVNQEVELNMLLRLAAEAIATKNAAVVTQDYARANAIFLGYKANFKPRELQYNFDFAHANLDPRSKEPIVLEKLLRTVTGFVQGWQIEDKETVVGFLQKLMFSAGIIKAVFFRGKKQQKELNREMTSMAEDEKVQEAKFEAFIKEINDPNSRFNRDSPDKPIAKDITTPEK